VPDPTVTADVVQVVVVARLSDHHARFSGAYVMTPLLLTTVAPEDRENDAGGPTLELIKNPLALFGSTPKDLSAAN